ncbi:hypothetical protein JXA32_05770 [Candidatus Sumerlaeota bacterium]|nr:hypothetical protein [Candidatus Sumerlaeota bacterium]
MNGNTTPQTPPSESIGRDVAQRAAIMAGWITLCGFCCYAAFGSWQNGAQYAMFSLWGVFFLLVIRRFIMAIFRKDGLSTAGWGAANAGMMLALLGLCLLFTALERLSAAAMLLGIHTIYLALIWKALRSGSQGAGVKPNENGTICE